MLTFETHFLYLTNPRAQQRIEHRPLDIVMITICAVEKANTRFATKIFSLQDFTSLPERLITELHQAAIAVDAEKSEKLMVQIPDSHQHIA